ncbi:MAG: HlyD family efflux transporter periplasmic adaptor subunit [Planctomycetota bacterium]
MKSTLTHLVGLALLGLVALGALQLVGATPGRDTTLAATRAARALPVEVAQIHRQHTVSLPSVYSGELAARRSTVLSFEVPGTLVEVLVDEGLAVADGAPLARLDASRIEAQRDELSAQRRAAAATLDELIAGPRAESIDAARADVAAATASLELVDARLERRRGLSGSAVAEEVVRDLESERAAVAARLAASAAVLAELEGGTRLERIEAQRAALERVDAALASLALDLGDTTLYAPFEGVIGRRYVDEGTLVAAGAPVLELVEVGHLEARIGVATEAAAALAAGAEARLTVRGERVAVRAVRVLPQLDRGTRARTVVFELEPTPASPGATTTSGARAAPAPPQLAHEAPHSALGAPQLAPGETVRVEVDLAVPADGFWVPIGALSESTRGLWSLYVAGPSSGPSGQEAVLQRVDVEVLHTLGARAFVRGALTDDDRIVASGTHRLAPGQRVTLTPAVAAAPPTTHAGDHAGDRAGAPLGREVDTGASPR